MSDFNIQINKGLIVDKNLIKQLFMLEGQHKFVYEYKLWQIPAQFLLSL